MINAKCPTSALLLSIPINLKNKTITEVVCCFLTAVCHAKTCTRTFVSMGWKKKVIERRAIENNSKPRNFNITSQTFLYESVIKQAKLNIC